MENQIDVDGEVWEYLQQQAEPLVDTPNSVLRRLLGLGCADADEAVKATETSKGSAGRSRSTKRRTRSGASRAPAGTLLPSGEYELPTLRVLAESQTVQVAASEVTRRVGELIGDRLTELDREHLKSGAVRWEARVQFTRLRLVDRGLMKKDSPRGI